MFKCVCGPTYRRRLYFIFTAVLRTSYDFNCSRRTVYYNTLIIIDVVLSMLLLYICALNICGTRSARSNETTCCEAPQKSRTIAARLPAGSLERLYVCEPHETITYCCYFGLRRKCARICIRDVVDADGGCSTVIQRRRKSRMT